MSHGSSQRQPWRSDWLPGPVTYCNRKAEHFQHDANILTRVAVDLATLCICGSYINRGEAERMAWAAVMKDAKARYV
jgi:hypothetical protein